MGSAEPQRQCPYCGTTTTAPFCEQHSAPTIDLSLVSMPSAPVTSGHVLAERYRVDEALGEGLSGVVHRATQLAFGRKVAVKIVKSRTFFSPKPLLRFFREAHSIGRLNHPNIVQVFDFGIDNDTRAPYLVFELVDGRTLTDIIRGDGPLEPRRASRLMAQTARALAEAHDLGIVHRDIKPNNLMVTTLVAGVELVKVLDFGLAKVQSDLETGGRLTAPGKLVGTPHFASPEQALGGVVDARSDLYSLGCTLYAAIAGRAPFLAKTTPEVVKMHRAQPAPRLPVEDPRLSALYEALLAKQPSERPASAVIVAEIFEAIAEDRAIDLDGRLYAARTHVAPLPLTIESQNIPTAETLDPNKEDPTTPTVAPTALDLDTEEPPEHTVTVPEAAQPMAFDDLGIPTRITGDLEATTDEEPTKVAPEPAMAGSTELVEMPTPSNPGASRSSMPIEATFGSAVADPAATGMPRLTTKATERSAAWLLVGLIPIAGLTVWLVARPTPNEVKPAAPVQDVKPTVAEAPTPMIAPRALDRITVQVESRPTGAVVKIGDLVVGETPVDVTVPAGEEAIDLRFEKTGFVTGTLRLGRDAPPPVVELAPMKTTSSKRSPKPKPKPKPTKSPEKKEPKYESW